MAIKKATGPGPKKGFNPTRSIGTKTFGKILKPGQKSDVYYFEEGVVGGGQGGIKNTPKSMQYKSTPDIAGMVKSKRTAASPKKSTGKMMMKKTMKPLPKKK
jgi:hypothetical protein